MKKLASILTMVAFTIVLTSYNNNDNDQVSGDTNSTQMNEPGGEGGVIRILRP